MSAPITLPSTLSGLDLLDCPVIFGARRGLVAGITGQHAILALQEDVRWRPVVTVQPLSAIGLDLRRPIGVWRAATWMVAAAGSDARWRGFTAAELELLEQAVWNEQLTDEDLAELRALALEVDRLLLQPRVSP